MEIVIREIMTKLLKEVESQWALILILVSSVLIPLGFKFFKPKLITWLSSLLNVRKAKDLKDHYIFSTLPMALAEVKSRNYYTHGKFDHVKTKMCYDFTKHKVEVCTNAMLSFLEIDDLDSMKKDRLKNTVLELQNTIHVTYVQNITNDWLGRGIPKDNVLYVVDLFERFRAPVIERFNYQIEQIFGTELNQTNFERIKDVYDMWSGGIKDLPKDMRETFEAMNGKFRDIDYGL